MNNQVDFNSNMVIIKKFYTYLGNFIDVGEYNDPEEVEFLSEYLNEFDNAYEEWYQSSEECENADEATSSSDEEETNEYTLDSNDSSILSNSLEERVDSKKLNKIKNKSLDEFMSSNSYIDNILLYKNNSNLLDRCNLFMESVYQY